MEYRFQNEIGPFYRKGMAGDNVWFEINKDGQGGLWLHIGNSHEGILPEKSPPPVHFHSEEQFIQFCVRIMGYDALQDWEDLWRRYA